MKNTEKKRDLKRMYREWEFPKGWNHLLGYADGERTPDYYSNLKAGHGRRAGGLKAVSLDRTAKTGGPPVKW